MLKRKITKEEAKILENWAENRKNAPFNDSQN